MEASPPSPPLSSQIFHSPPAHPSTSFPVLAIALIGILATAFLLVSYYIFVIKCCLNWQGIDVLNRFFSRRRDLNDDILTSTNASSPDGNGRASQKGLDEALIRSIPVIKFRKLVERRQGELCDNKHMSNDTDSDDKGRQSQSHHDVGATYECAVCLSEFEEGEKLRVIPNCCHAFHIDCIDIWLQSNANCPLCRSAISPSSILYNNNAKIFDHPQYQHPCSTTNDNHGSDSFSGDDDDYVVIEIEGNNLDEPRLVPSTTSTNITLSSEDEMKECKKMKKLGHVCSMGDELIDSIRKKDEEFQVQPIRRSISMDLSSGRELCHEIQQYCRSNMQVSEVISSSSSSGASNSSKVRRSIFSFGYGRGSRGSVQPVVHLDP